MKQVIDILCLGLNMGNTEYRFFTRYDEAEQDYYDVFRWLIKFNNKYPQYRICIKHHSGHYKPETEYREMELMKGKKLIYLDNQLNSYELASQSKMVVSYFSTMILELRGYPHLAHYIREQRKKKRYLFKKPCEGDIRGYKIYPYKYPPAYYLDPYGRNRQFCKNIDDICVHDCRQCDNPPYMEIFDPYRIATYKMFEMIAKEVLGNG